MKLPTRVLMLAAATLLSLTAACGPGGIAILGNDADSVTRDTGTAAAQNAGTSGAQDTDPSGVRDEAAGGGEASSAVGTGGDGAGRAAICIEARKVLQDFSQEVSGANAGNLAAYNNALDELSAKLDGLAGRADGELRTTLSAMARTWGGMKIDPSDPVGSTSKVLEATKEAGEQAGKLAQACA